MTATFYNTTDNVLKVTKELTNGTQYNILLKENTDVVKPTIILTGVLELSKNYVYIPTFSRYYFIVNKTIMTGGRMEIDLKCDVLTSFSTEIYASRQLIMRNENIGLNMITDTQFPIAPNSQIRVAKFENS